MSAQNLTPGEMKRARKRLSQFNFFNVISFVLLSGNIITLFSLRLGVTTFLIGLLSFFNFAGYAFILIGRQLVHKYGVVRLMGRFWLLRYILMVPILFAPLLAIRDLYTASHALIILSVLGFNVARGIAITGYNPIISEITTEKERGGFLARLQAVTQSITLVLGILMALLLGQKAPLYIYSFFISAGIITGLYGASIFLKLPEPGSIRERLSENLLQSFIKALRRPSFRKFTLVHFLICFATFMASPFLIVYAKKVYLLPDNLVVFFTVFGSLGGIITALISGFMIDRLGAKPLYFIFTTIITLSLVPLIAAPPLRDTSIFVFFAILFFFHNLGSIGIINTGQTYYLNAIQPEERVNLGGVYFFIEGVGAGLGSLIGGILLDRLQGVAALTTGGAFQIYFIVSIALFFFLLVLAGNLERLGAYPIRDVLGIIFSPRDLRAISLLHRLGRSQSLSEEKKVIQALAQSQSELPISDILARLRSPRFTIRIEALKALERLSSERDTVQALTQEVKNRTYTSAALAAEIIGKKGYSEAIPVLRKQLYSRDYYLSGECMVALARLGDRESIPAVRDITLRTSNPRLLIHGAVALEIFKDISAIPVLVKKLERKTSPYLRDEIILAIAGILHMGEWFYPFYMAFLEKSTDGLSMLKDYVIEHSKQRSADSIMDLLDMLPWINRKQFAEHATAMLEKLNIRADGVNVSAYFVEALRQDQYTRLDRFCFLIAALIALRTAKARA